MRAFVTALMFATAAAFAATTEDPSGLWANDNSILEISRTDSGLAAVVVAINDPSYGEGESERYPAGEPRRDENNPDPSLRERMIVGLNLLQGFALDGGKWRGKLYDPETGNWYSAQITVNRRGKLRMRGYIGMPMLGRTVEFEPASSCAAHIREMAERTDKVSCND